MNTNIFVTEEMRDLRTALVGLSECIERRKIADLSIQVSHPNDIRATRAPATLAEWIQQTAADLDILHVQIRQTKRKSPRILKSLRK